MPQPSRSRGRAETPAELDITVDLAAANRSLLIGNLRTAAAIVERSGADLPEILSIGVTAKEITIQPWLPGAPVQAAQAFEQLMEAPVERTAFPNPLPDGEASGISLISVSGTIGGAKVTVTVATYRDTPVDGFLGVTEQALTALAEQETPHSTILAESISSPALMKAVGKRDDDRADADGREPDAADPDPDGSGDERPEGAAEG